MSLLASPCWACYGSTSLITQPPLRRSCDMSTSPTAVHSPRGRKLTLTPKCSQRQDLAQTHGLRAHLCGRCRAQPAPAAFAGIRTSPRRAGPWICGHHAGVGLARTADLT